MGTPNNMGTSNQTHISGRRPTLKVFYRPIYSLTDSYKPLWILPQLEETILPFLWTPLQLLKSEWLRLL